MTSQLPPRDHELQSLTTPSTAPENGENKSRSHQYNSVTSDSFQNRQQARREWQDIESRGIPIDHGIETKKIGWWEKNIAPVLPLNNDVRDHFGEIPALQVWFDHPLRAEV